MPSIVSLYIHKPDVNIVLFIAGAQDSLSRRADPGADPDQPPADQLPDGGAGADAADLPGEPPQLGRHPQLRLALQHAQPQGRRHARHGRVVQKLAGKMV